MKQKKLLTITLLPFALLFFIVGVVILYRFIRSNLIQAGTDSAVRYTESINQGLASYFENWTLAVELLSKMPGVQQKQWDQLDPIFDRFVLDHRNITSFILADTDGTFWYSGTRGNPAYNFKVSNNDADPSAPLMNISDTSYFQRLITDNTQQRDMQIISELFISEIDSSKILMIAASVKNQDGIDGLIGCAVDAQSLVTTMTQLLADFEQEFGTNSMVIITSDDTHVMTCYEYNSSIRMYRDIASAEYGLITKDILPPEILEAMDKQESQLFFDWSGRRALLTRTTVPDTSYTIHLVVPESVLLVSAFPISAIIIILVSVLIIIGTVITIIRRSRELADANAQLSEANMQAEKDMRLAVYVQQSFYPRKAPAVQGWDIAYEFRPMSGVSGDLFDFYTSGNNLAGLALFDVSGHGIAAGLVAMLAKTIIAREFKSGENTLLANVMKKISDSLVHDKGDIENYMTGILMRITGNKIEYVNAAHPMMFWRSPKGTVVPAAVAGQSPQGSIVGIPGLPTDFSSIAFPMKEGDALLCYTDCLPESRNKAGEEFGEDRIKEAFASAGTGDAQTKLNTLLASLANFTAGVPLKDDLTIIVLQRTGGSYGSDNKS